MKQDLETVQQILVDTWHATYDALYGVDVVTEISNEWHSLERLEANLNREKSEFLVADNGFVLGGLAYATEKDRTITLEQLYVHPKYQGGKSGLHLMVEIENSFLDVEKIELEVEVRNKRAVEFYEEYGFKPLGEVESIEFSGHSFSLLRMSKPVVYADD